MPADHVEETTNVLRFPTEERARPTLAVMRALAPDVRGLDLLAETWSLPALPWDMRDRIDKETAVYIATCVDREPGPSRNAQLRSLLDPVVIAAVEAARTARRAWAEAQDASHKLPPVRNVFSEALEERVEEQARQAAAATWQAFQLCEHAEGVARAVSFARNAREWTPRNTQNDMEALIQLRLQSGSAG